MVDPEFEGFSENITLLGQLTGEDTTSWTGYLNALMQRRAFFKSMGATSTDHGHPSAVTANLEPGECETLYTEALKKGLSGKKAEMFRGQMLTEMARMSLEDGLVMQIHPGSFRNHNQTLFQSFGRDMGGRHTHSDGLCPCTSAAAQPIRQRTRVECHPLHPRRDQL